MRDSACNMSFETFPTLNKVSRKLHINTNNLGNTTQITKIQYVAQKTQYNVWVGLSNSI